MSVVPSLFIDMLSVKRRVNRSVHPEIESIQAGTIDAA